MIEIAKAKELQAKLEGAPGITEVERVGASVRVRTESGRAYRALATAEGFRITDPEAPGWEFTMRTSSGARLFFQVSRR